MESPAGSKAMNISGSARMPRMIIRMMPPISSITPQTLQTGSLEIVAHVCVARFWHSPLKPKNVTVGYRRIRSARRSAHDYGCGSSRCRVARAAPRAGHADPHGYRLVDGKMRWLHGLYEDDADVSMERVASGEFHDQPSNRHFVTRRVPDAPSPLVIDLRRCDVLVVEQVLDRLDRHS